MSTQKPTTKEYFRNYPGFRIESGVLIESGELKGKTTDFSVVTDQTQGFSYYKDGYYKSICNGTSYELCGYKSTTEDDYAKILTAGSGHILIDAQDGDIILKGRNIRLSAEDGSGEITLVSGKHVYIKGAVCHIRGTNVNILGSNNLSLGATFVENTGSVSNEGGTMTDIFQGSFLGGILKFLDKFKDFF
tara:strand:+ start:13261 stop:13830 length:570 start_codon:yes stop_codon:yes gene_type:complete